MESGDGDGDVTPVWERGEELEVCHTWAIPESRDCAECYRYRALRARNRHTRTAASPGGQQGVWRPHTRGTVLRGEIVLAHVAGAPMAMWPLGGVGWTAPPREVPGAGAS